MKNEVSEIDKYIKTMVLTDAFKVLTCGIENVKELGSFEKIFPRGSSSNKKYECLTLLDDLRQIFEGMAGSREFSGITSS